MLFVAMIVLVIVSSSLIKWWIEEKQEQKRREKLAKYRIEQQRQLIEMGIFKVSNVIFINPRKLRLKAINSSDDKLHS